MLDKRENRRHLLGNARSPTKDLFTPSACWPTSPQWTTKYNLQDDTLQAETEKRISGTKENKNRADDSDEEDAEGPQIIEPLIFGARFGLNAMQLYGRWIFIFNMNTCMYTA